MWLLVQLRQPGRSLFSYLKPTTFSRILKQLLGKENFGLKKELQGKFLTAPCCEHCMSYEFELRREAYKQCRETTIGISAAWWNAYRSQQHRMMHWLQLVSLANSFSSSSASSSQMAKMQKEIKDLRNEVRNRSRTPTVFQKQNKNRSGRRALANSQQLALPASGSAAPATNQRSRQRRRKETQQSRTNTEETTPGRNLVVRAGCQSPRTPAFIHAEECEPRCVLQVPEPSLQRLQLSPGALLHWLWRLQAVRRVPLPPRSY